MSGGCGHLALVQSADAESDLVRELRAELAEARAEIVERDRQYRAKQRQIGLALRNPHLSPLVKVTNVVGICQSEWMVGHDQSPALIMEQLAHVVGVRKRHTVAAALAVGCAIGGLVRSERLVQDARGRLRTVSEFRSTGGLAALANYHPTTDGRKTASGDTGGRKTASGGRKRPTRTLYVTESSSPDLSSNPPAAEKRPRARALSVLSVGLVRDPTCNVVGETVDVAREEFESAVVDLPLDGHDAGPVANEQHAPAGATGDNEQGARQGAPSTEQDWRNGSWRQKPVTDKQRRKLAGLGVAVPTGMTSGEASDAIEMAERDHDPSRRHGPTPPCSPPLPTAGSELNHPGPVPARSERDRCFCEQSRGRYSKTECRDAIDEYDLKRFRFANAELEPPPAPPEPPAEPPPPVYGPLPTMCSGCGLVFAECDCGPFQVCDCPCEPAEAVA